MGNDCLYDKEVGHQKASSCVQSMRVKPLLYFLLQEASSVLVLRTDRVSM